ncbi:cobalt-precorrin-6A reductase [Sinorhizobium sp. BG8]|uniref:cobalt-precorrin-6A reductase n=1 Tax=Sinorhizobium sp. BG8 TaxID=2613773 RepID=UPI00193E447E|nr:cobalt-precorrin-6A reductase [Sinorhizobium sp. BG8]QRM53571.1 cobalt-precorrin-6A reductase [Sinorhizobium sp. BG8]
MNKKQILILGGTTEARDLAARLATREDIDVVLSLAGRTADPAPQPTPVRIGGFGGVGGLVAYLRSNAVDLLVDATHPFARRISVNARQASAESGVPLLRLERAGWDPVAGDQWVRVSSVDEAATALGHEPRRIFLAIGRQEVAAFEAAPQHHYLVRSVDPVEPPLDVPSAEYSLARGPFEIEGEIRLLRNHRIDAIVSKNSGGEATYAKIAAARALRLTVIMIERAQPSDGITAENVGDAVRLVDHLISPDKKRGV